MINENHQEFVSYPHAGYGRNVATFTVSAPPCQESLTMSTFLLPAGAQPPSSAALALSLSCGCSFSFSSSSLWQGSNWSLAPWQWLLLLCLRLGAGGAGRGCQRPAPGASSLPLDGFLAESPSHTHRHLLRCGLSEAWAAGALGMGQNVGLSCDLHQYGPLRIDGLNLMVRGTGGVFAHNVDFLSLLLWHPTFCLCSHMFLTLGFCPFFACSILHIAASLLCLLASRQGQELTSCSVTGAENKTTFS